MNDRPAELRPARPEEAAAVAALTEAAYAVMAERVGYPPQPVTADHAAFIEDGRVEVLEDAGRIVGVLVCWPEPDHLLLYSVAVAPDRQGRGHGRAMMAAAEAAARRRGLGRIVLYTNEKMPENVAYYEALGYRRFDRRPHPTEPGSWTLYLEKEV